MRGNHTALPEARVSATVTSKGQITIPKAVREQLGIGPGSVVDFERAEDGRIVLVKAGKKSRPTRFARLRGSAGKGMSTDEIMALTRGES